MRQNPGRYLSDQSERSAVPFVNRCSTASIGCRKAVMDERQKVAGYGPFDFGFRLVTDLRFLKLGGGKQSVANCESLDRPSPGANGLCAARVALQAAAIW